MKTIKFTHGIVTPICGDVKGGEMCIVSINGDDLHPVDAEILAINCGYLSFCDMIKDFKDDCSGIIDSQYTIKKL